MLDAKVLREITNVNRVKLLEEAKQELFSDIEREAKRGRNTYLVQHGYSYLDGGGFKFTKSEIEEVIDKLTALGYILTKSQDNTRDFIVSW